jgi:predicted dehydrogenase
MTSRPQALRIGVLGCANIARQFIAAVRPHGHATIEAVASRRPDTAAAFARDCGIARHHGSYEDLLADPGVDTIYIPLPNSLHAEWAIKAARHGKHVLCEKPLALSRAEAVAMFAAAREAGVMLLEAYPWWFQPQTRDLVTLLDSGAIGRVRTVQASFGFTILAPDGNIRMNPDLGGGALLDAGSYPMSLIRLVMGEAPRQVVAHADWARSGVDISLMGTLLFADGRRAQLSCAMDVANHRRAVIMGTAGTIETEYINHPSAAVPSQLRIRRGIANTIPFEEIHSAIGSGFAYCAEAFARVVAARDFAAIERAAAASIDIAATLEALGKSARSGRPEFVAQD